MYDLVAKMVDTEREEMSALQPPEVDINDQYYTTVGITLFQMVDQNVREGEEGEHIGPRGRPSNDLCSPVTCRFLPCLHLVWKTSSR